MTSYYGGGRMYGHQIKCTLDCNQIKCTLDSRIEILVNLSSL